MALDELNSEYIALKRGQGSKDDPSTVLVSLRTRYNDIRAKVGNLWEQLAAFYELNLLVFNMHLFVLQYDALLKKRSQIDLDMAPLKVRKDTFHSPLCCAVR